MADAEELPLKSLQSTDQAELLDQIERLHTQGISHYVSLPQLIVCGDQSSGKSSVLEAISQVAFPTNDGLCTRFVTEVSLRRSSSKSAAVKISPAPFSNQGHQEKLKGFAKDQIKLKQLPQLIESAKKVMDLSGDSTFSEDILQIEISGPDLPHLTLVDMPGLIHTPNRSQTPQDVEIVQTLVKRYMKAPRSIILAVVSAKNDLANQIVLQMAKSFDEDSVRTMGIITKPDTLQPGSPSESSFFSLAKNNDTSFHLGWHVLRNADYCDTANDDYDRDETERAFFANRTPWDSLPASNVGIKSLRTRLSKVLLEHISNELPSLVRDIQSGIESCRQILKKLGPARNSTEAKQLYLLTFAERFKYLVQAGLAGQYSDPFFRSAVGEPNRRLRAVIRGLSQRFATAMETRGHSKVIGSFTSRYPIVGEAKLITRSDFLAEIQLLVQESKGIELPGTFNPLLVFDLFVQHAEPWERIAKEHIEDCWVAVKFYLEDLTDHLTEPSVKVPILRDIVDPAMEESLQILKDKLDELLTPYMRGFPATLNCQFMTRVQHLRKRRSEEKERDASLGMDMDIYACSELLDCMLAYYSIARDVFVDNVEALAVENCLVRNLDEIASIYRIAQMGEEELNKFGSESVEAQQERREAKSKLETLTRGLQICNRHTRSATAARLRTKSTGVASQGKNTPGVRDANGLSSNKAHLFAPFLAANGHSSKSQPSGTTGGSVFDNAENITAPAVSPSGGLPYFWTTPLPSRPISRNGNGETLASPAGNSSSHPVR